MLRHKAFAVLVFLFALRLYSQAEFVLQPGTVVVPVDGDRAKELIMTEDEYTASLSRFDLMSKTGRIDNHITVKDYLEYSAAQVETWSRNEEKVLGEIVASVSEKIKSLGLYLKMPEKIEVIKSTMKNEGGAAGYTRGTYIVLKSSRVSEGGYDNLFIHELFHVLSRYDKEMSEKVYNTLGFKKTNEVKYPLFIKDRKISNPDAPFNNFFITVQKDEKPVDVMLVLFSDKDYEGGSFFSYLKVGLMEVSHTFERGTVPVNGARTEILKIKDVENFYEQIGKNTDYIFHAEEISADHFELLLNQDKNIPNPELIEAMKNVMK